jgi:hypothetical protein
LLKAESFENYVNPSIFNQLCPDSRRITKLKAKRVNLKSK